MFLSCSNPSEGKPSPLHTPTHTYTQRKAPKHFLWQKRSRYGGGSHTRTGLGIQFPGVLLQWGWALEPGRH